MSGWDVVLYLVVALVAARLGYADGLYKGFRDGFEAAKCAFIERRRR